jgi:hypothetical protein
VALADDEEITNLPELCLPDCVVVANGFCCCVVLSGESCTPRLILLPIDLVMYRAQMPRYTR